MWGAIKKLFVKAVTFAVSPEGQALIKEGVDIGIQVEQANKK